MLSVLSEDIVLLIRLREPALELCRLSDIGPNAKLETVCILALPEMTTSASLRWATCFGEHPGHALFSKGRHPPEYAPGEYASTPMQQPREGKGARRNLQSVPADGIISVVMHVHGLSGYFRTIDLSVRCRALLGFTDPNSPTWATAWAAQAVRKPVEGEREREWPRTLPGVVTRPGEEDSLLIVPWEEWGPANTRILEHDSLTWGSLVGERRATVGQVRPTVITMRDYNPFRVRRALARTGGGAGAEVKLECGSVIKVVDNTSVYRGGEWFYDDIESSLPYVETVTPYPGCEGIFMDEDNLMAEVRTEVSSHKTIVFLLFCD